MNKELKNLPNGDFEVVGQNFNQMSNNKYIPLPGGDTCKKVNPYEQKTMARSTRGTRWYENPQWALFEATNPILPITEVMPEGDTFEGVDAHQIQLASGQWVTVGWKPLIGSDPYRPAIKPLKAIEPVREYMCPNCTWKSPVFTECEQCKTGLDMIPTPLVDVVESTNTLSSCSEKPNNSNEEVENKKTVGNWKIKNYGYQMGETGDYMTTCLLTTGSIELMVNEATDSEEVQELCDHLNQSIEGIVGFVLEWVTNNAKMVKRIDGEIIHERTQGFYYTDGDIKIDTEAILNMKSNIIKELKNGK